jgi:NAD(P)-dependent dehydrogenase (short-subunit alcohol dehydrogenase family)
VRKLTGKIALITGGNSGIGLASAKAFVGEGAHVLITGRRATELDKAVKEIGRNVTDVLITGATGSTGRSATQALIKEGFAVRALVHQEDERSATHPFDLLMWHFKDRATFHWTLRAGLVVTVPAVESGRIGLLIRGCTKLRDVVALLRR